MADSIDAWYHRELEFLQSAGADFANRYGKIADRLSLSATGTKDPHVERLLQGVAFMNARIRQKLDDSFPELAQALLGVLYPHLVAPIPSMSIVQMNLNEQQADLVKGYSVSRLTDLETQRVQSSDGKNTTGQFRTCFPVKIFPLKVAEAEMVTPPFQAPRSKRSAEAESALHFTLTPFVNEIPLSNYAVESLRFYVDLRSFERAARLIELLSAHSLEVAIVSGDGESIAGTLSPKAISQVGFDQDEAILPEAAQSFPGYRLLTEYFAMPQKFLFFELNGLTPEILSRCGEKIDIWVYLDQHDADLESLVRPNTLKLGCTPIVNLFSQTADAIKLSRNVSEYRIIPDGRAERFKEIYSVDKVNVAIDDKDDVDYVPFFSVSHSKESSRSAYWHATRRPGPAAREYGVPDGPTEMYLTLVDDEFHDVRIGRGSIRTRLTCFNREIPESLAKHELSQIKFRPAKGAGAIGSLNCLVPPTNTTRRHLGVSNLWPLISQLSLNHLSLTGPDGKTAFQELLRLNDPVSSVHTDRLVKGILSIAARPSLQRIDGVFVRGTEIELQLDDESFVGDSAFLFCGVIDRFLSMYASLNSFTRLSANTTNRKQKKVSPWKWIPKAGNRPLI